MVNYSKALTGLSRAFTLTQLVPTDLAMINALQSLNNTFGFTPNADGALPASRFRVENNKVKVGNISLDEFFAMSKSDQVNYLKTSTDFDDTTRVKVGLAIDQNFVDVATRAKVLKLSDQGLLDMQKKISPDGSINTSHPSWTKLMSSLTTLSLLAGGVAWSLTLLNELVEANSGCFLVGPNGEETRLGTGDCNCATTDASGAVNLYRQACCTACKSHGDTSLICPGDTPSATWTQPYVCPTDPIPTPVAAMRSALSTSATVAMARAEALARAKKTTPVTYATAISTCQSCGCKTESWTLCYRKATVWGVIVGIAADAGKILTEAVDGFVDIGADALGGLLSGVLRPIVISIGVAVGVAIIVAVVMLVVKKRRKQQPVQGGEALTRFGYYPYT